MFLKHKIYGLIFNLFRAFPVNDNKISLITNKSASFESNLREIALELDKRNDTGKNYEYHYILKDQISFKNFYHLATSRYIFLSDNFFALAFMNFSPKQKIIQLWHAPGEFKNFGYDFESGESQEVIRKFAAKTTNLFISSKNFIESLSHRFALDESKTIPTGIPRTDYYFRCDDEFKESLRANFDEKYPFARGKKIVLYAPTFRQNPVNNMIFDNFDIDAFNESLGDDYVLFIRLHPNYNRFADKEHFIDLESVENEHEFVNCTHYSNEQELLLLSDVLITDYSSVMVEYSILNKPIVLFAYDLDDYLSNERGFYFDYRENVPGRITYDMDELIRVFKENGESNNYKTNTDSSGNASLDLKDFTSGKYIVRVKYGGNDNYAGCNTTQKIEII